MEPSDDLVKTTSSSDYIIYATPPSPDDLKRVIYGIEFNGNLSNALLVLCKEISDLKKRVEELESLK